MCIMCTVYVICNEHVFLAKYYHRELNTGLLGSNVLYIYSITCFIQEESSGG